MGESWASGDLGVLDARKKWWPQDLVGLEWHGSGHSKEIGVISGIGALSLWSRKRLSTGQPGKVGGKLKASSMVLATPACIQPDTCEETRRL